VERLCYVVVNDGKERSWKDAQDICSSWGRSSHLASILRSSQQNYLEKSATQNSVLFIGASDSIRDGKWRWDDGRDITFTNWRLAPGFGPENCSIMERDGKWSPVDCEDVMFSAALACSMDPRDPK